MNNTCVKCGYSWNARSEEPLRCPSCKSTRWNKTLIRDKCLRCNSEWIQRGDSAPKYCPVCHSARWAYEKRTCTCPRCGKTRVLKANSRAGLCSECKIEVGYSKPRTGCEPPSAGINKVIRLWSDGKGLTLNYICSEDGKARLYNKGVFLGEIDIEAWCKSNGYKFSVKNQETIDGLHDAFSEAASRIKTQSEISSNLVHDICELRGVSPTEAKIIRLYETGMGPASIALKLNISFSRVMDIISNIPPIQKKVRLKKERPGQNITNDSSGSKTVKEKA